MKVHQAKAASLRSSGGCYRDPVSRVDSRRNYYLVYTVVFLATACLMFLPFLLSGRSFVWAVDGRAQYYLHMIHMRRYLRDFFSGLFHGNPHVTLYEFTLGMGDDILGVVRMHPLDLLCVFVPESFMAQFYSFVILLRLYLAGVAFSAYCRYRKADSRAILAGAVVYLSGGFAIRRVTMHPFFGAALIMLPLMFLGVEKILKEKKGLFLAFSVFLGFMGSYYFAYMCTIAVGVYFLLRFPETIREERGAAAGTAGAAEGAGAPAGGKRSTGDSVSLILSFFGKGFHVLGAWALGFFMISWLILPTFTRLFSSDRLKTDGGSGIISSYPAKQFRDLAVSLISPNYEAGYNTMLNFIALVIPAVIILCAGSFRKHISLKLALIIEAAALVVPAAGFVMGAFGNVSNRWTFILGFTLAIFVVRAAEKGPEIGKRPLRILLALTGLYLAACLAMVMFGGRFHFSRKYQLYISVGGTELALTTAVLWIMSRRKVSRDRYFRILTCLAVACAAMTGITSFQPGLGGAVSNFVAYRDLPAYYERLPQAELADAGDAADASFFRADTSYVSSGSMNASLYFDYNGVSVFNSVLNGSLQQFLLELDSPGLNGNIKIVSMDGSAILENLANVRLFLSDKKSEIVPYGFEKIRDSKDGKAVLYGSRIPLNFGFCYDSCMTGEEYEKLSPLEKQQALLRSVILEEPPEGLKQITADDAQSVPEGGRKEAASVKEVSLTPARLEGKVKPGSETGKEAAGEEGKAGLTFGKGGEVSYTVRKQPGCEFYLFLKGVKYKAPSGSEDDESLTVSAGAGKKELRLRDKENAYYIPREDYLICLGYADQEEDDTVTVRFNGNGRCVISDVCAGFLPMDTYKDEIAARNAGGCTNPVFSVNTVSGSLAEGGDRFAVFSIPYGKGWKAELDGKEVQIFRADRAYMGFFVPEGAHTFRLSYFPPGLSAGLKLTVAGWTLFVVSLLSYICAKARRKKEERF